MTTRTFIFFKPEAIGHVGEIISRFERKGFHFDVIKTVFASARLVEEHYLEHHNKSFYRRLCDQMIGKAIITAVVSHPHFPNVVETARELVGKYNQPGTIRGDFSQSFQLNMIHASDSIESAEKEIKLWLQ